MRHLLSAALLALPTWLGAAESPQSVGPDLTRTFPYSMVGQLLFQSGNGLYGGSGTVIRPSSALTAGHNLYDFNNGWSTGVVFRRALSGNTALSRQPARRIYVLAGYRESLGRFGAEDARSFANDLGGIVFAGPAAGGAAVDTSADTTLLTGATANLALGYGAEFHPGDELLAVSPKTAFQPVTGAFFLNRSLSFEAGMSGGPVLARNSRGQWRVSGVVVAGSNEPVSGGIRAVDAQAVQFIRQYLR